MLEQLADGVSRTMIMIALPVMNQVSGGVLISS
jgi:hypothetical protein